MSYFARKHFLISNGFVFLRHARHGAIYYNKFGDRIMLPRPGNYDPRAERNFNTSLNKLLKPKNIKPRA